MAAVATDIPDITHSVVLTGLELLDTYDVRCTAIQNLCLNDILQVVLGPAVDGGFYFLGVNDLTKELFDVILFCQVLFS